jgi:hypothetical protein
VVSGRRGGLPGRSEKRPLGLAADDPVDRQAVPPLEALDGAHGQWTEETVDRAGACTQPPKAALQSSNGIGSGLRPIARTALQHPC